MAVKTHDKKISKYIVFTLCSNVTVNNKMFYLTNKVLQFYLNMFIRIRKFKIHLIIFLTAGKILEK